jgi:hypothetical protein
MKTYPLCDPFFWEDPKILFQAGFRLRPRKEGPCASELANQIFTIYFTAFVVGVILQALLENEMLLVISLGVGTAFVFPSLWSIMTVKADLTEEGFQGGGAELSPAATLSGAAANAALEEKRKASAAMGRTLADQRRGTGSTEAYEVYDVIGKKGASAAPASLTLPSARNPFMNVLIDEIKYNPTRPMAASVYDPSVKVALDDFFRTDFHRDPTDVFGRSQGQRQFVTMPSTGIPNDVDSYQNWLYKIPGKTCKEGGREACLPGTDGGALPWLNREA